MILDSGAVIALARGDHRAREHLASALDNDALVFVPAVVVAETTRGEGPRDAPVNRILAAVDAVPPADEEGARTAGRLLGRARSDATVDALVVATAVHLGGGVILTGDPDDLRALSWEEPSVRIRAL